MYCPKCGAADQKTDAYCRACGFRLPDFEKLARSETPPETHLNANAVLSLMTGLASLVIAVLLYVSFLGKSDTPVLVYVTAGFLTAIFGWQVQVFWRTILLRRQFARIPKAGAIADQAPQQLPEADFANRVPAGVTETTTRDLGEKVARQSP